MGFKIFLIITILFFPFIVQGASPIDINSAPLEELEEIIDIGPVLSQRIIETRPFDSLDDLIKVKGIGEKTLQKIKDQGLARVASQEKLGPGPAAPEGNNPRPAETKSLPAKAEKVEAGHPPAYPNGIVFNEILPSPEGPDLENEWIEIFNQNNFVADISGWTVKDKIGTPTIYVFPAGSKISALEYLILKRPETKITLNNSGDGLEISNPNGETVDSIDFGKATIGQSYNKAGKNWLWSTTLTPETKNIMPTPQIGQEPSSTKKEKVEAEPLPAEPFSEKETAAVGEKILKTFNSLLVLLISLSIALFSAVIILFLKKTLSNHY